jgi:glycosyltransferase involved in cell wall biosynthesis
MHSQVIELRTPAKNGAPPLRVLHLGSPTGLYGAERWIIALVRHLDVDEVESVVGVIRDQPGYRAELCEQAALYGAKTHTFDSFGRFNLTSVTQLRRFIRERQIDIVHTHGYKTDLVGLLATAGTPCRIISTPHGWTVEAEFKLKVYEAIDRLSFAFMSAVAPLSDQLHRELMRMPWLRRRLHPIRNGVDLSEVHAAPASCPEMEAFATKGEFRLGYIGRLHQSKGLDYLVRALALIPERSVRLCLIGEGPMRDELGKLAKQLGVADRVTFFGYRPDRLSFLKQMDAFVLPSLSEGIPRCVLEAMAANVAVIATDIPGCRPLVHDGRTGLLVPVCDAAALATAIAKLAGAPALRARLAAAGKTLVETEFSAAIMATRYQELYRNVTCTAEPRAPLAKAVE